MALSKIDVANMVTGAVPVANGGTALTSGTSGQFLKFTGSTTLASTAVTEGIGEADTWRVTSDYTGDASPIASNWERDDDDANGYIGTGMSQSSGLFTFPSTGYYLVTFYHTFSAQGDNEYVLSQIQYTADNGSNFGGATKTYGNAKSSGAFGMSVMAKIFDITDTSNQKIRFVTTSQDSNAITETHTGENVTAVTFLKLGAT